MSVAGNVVTALRLTFAGALIFTLYTAFAPSPDAPDILPWDKAAHLSAFFTLAVLAALSFPGIACPDRAAFSLSIKPVTR